MVFRMLFIIFIMIFRSKSKFLGFKKNFLIWIFLILFCFLDNLFRRFRNIIYELFYNFLNNWFCIKYLYGEIFFGKEIE